MTQAATLTVIIPCHQLDDRFLKAIESAQWAERVLVIDQNSKIHSSELKKKYHFDVIQHPHLTSFSNMKNQALKEVTTEWVFFLDSDEYITRTLAEEARKNIQMTNENAFEIRRVDIFLNKVIFHGETRSANFIRLVKKGKGEWRGKVHEYIQLTHHSSKIGKLKSPLYHEPHKSIFEFIQKINLYTSLLATQGKEQRVLLKSLVLPAGKFIYTFVIKQGFLDGYRGLIYSFIMAIHSSVVRIKRYEAQ
ncbi:MAG: glycosyltransferase family 2 protein [Patescibacteria group bacterium]